MSETVADFIYQRLREWGVKRIYAYPGDGINGMLGALDRAKDNPRWVQVRHEEMAAFMACAHAKFTGEVGVCLATSGPGAIHLLNGLYDAKGDHQPVVALVGQSATTVIGSHFQQEVNLMNLFSDVACEFCHQASHPAQIRHLIDRAFRVAMDQRTVTCVILPKDIQEMKAVPQPPHLHNSVHSGVGYRVPHIVPRKQDLREAADILNAGTKVAMLIGQGAMTATDEVIEAADRLGAGIAKAFLGKAAVPDDVPFCTGPIGLLGSRPSYEMMSECDTLLVVGSSFPYGEYYPKEGQAKGVQIDIDGRMLSLRYPMDVPLKGDAKETLQALIPLLERKRDREWQEKLIGSTQEWWKQLEDMAMQSANPINPQRVFWELSPKLPDRSILSADSGTAINWFARDLKVRRGMMASASGNLCTMGPAVPYAVAAKFCFPDRVAIALTGDGAMQMNGLNACITVSKYWREWDDPRWITLVLNNHDLNQVTWEQRILAGDPKFPASQDLPEFPYAQFAQSIGLNGVRVDKPEQVSDAWDQALSSDRPVVLEAIVDPDVPTLPPHITLKQAKNFMATLLEGDPNEAGIVTQAAKGMMERILH